MNSQDVFINCPFTADYDIHFKSILFTVLHSGFQPRCAREDDDSGPGGVAIADNFDRFMHGLPDMLAARNLQPADLTYDDDVFLMAEWLKQENQ